MADNAQLLPWSWKITPKSESTALCPPPSLVLGTFFIINVVVAIFGVIFGHRMVVKKMTCGLMGKPLSKSCYYMWVVVLGLNLGANLLNAWIIKKATGYDATFAIWEVMFLFCLRPRVSWIVLGSLLFVHRRSKTLERIGNQLEGEHADLASKIRDFPFATSAFSTLIAEGFLEFLSLIPLGKTVHFAATRGYYLIGTAGYQAIPNSAHLMYAGSLYALLIGIFAYIFVPLLVLETMKEIVSRQIRRNKKPSDFLEPSIGMLQAVMFFGVCSYWVALWIFWGGFLHLAGDLYCPPKLITQGAIWAALSSLGIFVGAGF